MKNICCSVRYHVTMVILKKVMESFYRLLSVGQVITLIKSYSSKENALIKCSDAIIIVAITVEVVLIVTSFEFKYTKERPIMIGTWERIKNHNLKRKYCLLYP